MVGVESLITLIIVILLLGLLVYALNWLLGQLALPQPVRMIILVIVAILVLLYVVRTFGLL